MNNIIYTDTLLKKDVLLYNLRMGIEETTSHCGFSPTPLIPSLYEPFLKLENLDSENKQHLNDEKLEVQKWKQLIDKFGIISIAIDEKYNTQSCYNSLDKAFEQLSTTLQLLPTQIGCGKLHIVLSSKFTKTDFYRADNEMMIHINSPEDINYLSKAWFHFADHVQTLGITKSPQSEHYLQGSSIAQLLDLLKSEEKDIKPNGILLANNFEIYLNKLLNKNNQISCITSSANKDLDEEKTDMWKMILNKFQKKLQFDKTRNVVKLRKNHSAPFVNKNLYDI